MSNSRQSPNQNRSSPAAAAPALCSIVYRSRAVAPLSGYDLYELVQSAQTRNETESITGLMLYEDGRFYQWLEGPAENVARVMKSITGDRRHTEIEVVSDRPIPARQFEGWKMRLATRGVRSIHSGHNVVVPTTAALDEIQRSPDHLPAVLAGLSNLPAPVEPVPASNFPLHGPAGALLKNVIVTAVLPELVSRNTLLDRAGAWPIGSRARALADLLIGPDNGAALELLRSLHGGEGAVAQLYESLIEPTARRLGDLWQADLCSEFDITIALGQLQRALHALHEDVLQPIIPAGLFLPSVLIVPEPGEMHGLNAMLDMDALTDAGWDSQGEYPVSDEALQDLIAGQWFDALDLSLSASFRRDHWLPRVTKTIALARHASRNPALVVVVAGRIFAEDRGAGAQVGADGTSVTATRAEQSIRAGLNARK